MAMKDLKKMKTCPDCGSTNIIYSKLREQIICRDCGLLFAPLTPEEDKLFKQVTITPEPHVKRRVRGKVKRVTKAKPAKRKPSKRKSPVRKKSRK